MRATAKGATGAARKAADGTDKGRMVHIRLEPELHRKLRLVVAAQDTTLQDWIARTLEDAANKAWAAAGQGADQ